MAFIEATDASGLRRPLAARLRAALLRLDQGPVERAVRRALGVLRSFSIQLPDGSAIAIDVEPLVGQADSGDLVSDTTDLLVAVGEARPRRTGLLIAVDEAQYLPTTEFGALIAAIHRTGQLDLPVVLVGAGLPQLPALAGEAKSYAERLFEFPEIGPLGREDAAAALALPAAEANVDFSDGALAMIVDASRGYPYFLQQWGSPVWNHAVRSPIDETDVARVGPLVREHLDRNFSGCASTRPTPKEKAYLRAMAGLGPGPHRSGDIAVALGVRVESVAPRRSGLIGKGMIYSPTHGDTAFTVPMFDDFLRRRLPEV